MIWDGIDKRKFPRVKYRCRVRIIERNKEQVFDTFTENIGAGGICVVLGKEYDLFRTARMEIYLSEKESPVKCEGAIVWVIRRGKAGKTGICDYDVGIEFTDINNEDREKIKKLVENLMGS